MPVWLWVGGYPQLSLQELVFFLQITIFSKQCLVFFKQLVDIHNCNPFTFLGGTLSQSHGIQIRENHPAA